MNNENTVANLEKPRSIADFLQQKRIFFTGLLIAVVGAVAVFFIVAGVLDVDTKKKLAALEVLVERYDKLADSIGHDAADTDVDVVTDTDDDADAVAESNADTDTNAVADTEADVASLRADLQTFAENARGYAGAKAWSLAGTIDAKQKKWADAENAFDRSAQRGVKTHLSGPSLFNAGVAAEEGGNIAKAIEYYTKSIGAPGTIVGARAQFSIGRLQEAQGDQENARLMYRKVIDEYADNSGATWRNLAQSRLLALDEK